MTSTQLPAWSPESSSPSQQEHPKRSLVDHRADLIYTKTRREEAEMFADEAFSSEYMDESEQFDEETTFFAIDAIIDDRVVTKNLLDAATGRMVETKIPEFLVAWKSDTHDMSWQREDRLREDGCGDLVDEYLDREENEEYVPPSKGELKRVAREEKRYERRHKKKIRSQIAKEREGLALFEDFQLPGFSGEGEGEEEEEDEPASEAEEEETTPPPPLSITSGWKSSRARCPTHKVRSPSF
jgi:hypothetical protein